MSDNPNNQRPTPSDLTPGGDQSPFMPDAELTAPMPDMVAAVVVDEPQSPSITQPFTMVDPNTLSARQVHRWFYWTFATVTVIAGLFCFGIPGVILLAVYLQVFILARTCREKPLLQTIRSASKRDMPLEPILEAYAAEAGSWRYRNKLLTVCGLLRMGESFPGALQAVGGVVRRRTLTYLWAGREVQRQPETIDRLCNDESREQMNLRMSLVNRLMFIAALLLFFCWISTCQMYFIVPSFVHMFQEFDFELPVVTRIMMAASDAMVHYWFLLFPIICGGMFFIGYLAVRTMFGITWLPWGVRRFFRRSETAEIIGLLALFVEADRPIAEGLEFLCQHYHNSWTRERLMKAAKQVNAGRPWSESLRRARLISRTDQALLDSAERVGNLNWAMRELSQSATRRALHRANSYMQVGFVGAILAICFLSATMAIGMMSPLIRLISELS